MSGLPLVILYSDHETDLVQREIARSIPERIRRSNLLHLEEVPDASNGYQNIYGRLKRLANKKLQVDCFDVLYTPSVRFPPTPPRSVAQHNVIKPSMLGDRLDRHLRRRGWDWISIAAVDVARWMHCDIDRRAVEEWLSQFDLFGTGHRWVGETLLRHHVMCSPDSLASSLVQRGDGPVQYCIVDSVAGKSSAIVANLVRKRVALGGVGGSAVRRLEDAIESGDAAAIVWVEDGLYSGTETVGVLDSLRGSRKPGRSQKARRVDAAMLTQRLWDRVILRTWISVDVGELRIRRYMKDSGVSFALESTQRINVLNDTGRELIAQDRFWDSRWSLGANPLAIREGVTPHAFSNPIEWGSENKRNRALDFCRDIGAQLWDCYLKRQGGWDLEKWPADVVRVCGLGMQGVGMNVALPHSVPKATLPVFWAAGHIQYAGRMVDWKPLYPNA